MKNSIKKMRSSLIAIAVLTAGWSSYSMADDTHRTGAKETTPQQEALIEKSWKKVKKVKPNKIGLERINKSRKKKNLPLLDDTYLAPMGEDVTGVLAATDSGGEEEALGAELSSVDNSTLSAFPGIGNQGNQGSCTAFATTYYQMTHNTALMRGWAHTDTSTIFSPKWTYNMINNGEDAGSIPIDAFTLLEKNGAAMWSEFPYDTSDWRKWPMVSEVWRNAIGHRTEGVQYVSSIDTAASLDQLKAILTNGYAATFATYISSWQVTTISDDTSTSDDDALIGQKVGYWVNGDAGGHMMTFVGYNDDIWVDINGNGTVDSGEKGALKVANSWGTGWSGGNNGFIWLAYDALKATSAVTGGPSSGRLAALWSNRVYHLIVQDHYTPKVLAKVTLNHAKRDQLRITLGVTDETQTTIWLPFVMNNTVGYWDGGPYAFDGSTTAIDGTFFFDFTDIVPTYDGTRWYVDMGDSVSGDPATLSLFELVDVTNGDSTVASTDVPQTVDSGSIEASVHYNYNGSNLLPHAIFEATPMSGYMPLEVDFNASASYDDDGSIVHYEWNFGDGSTIATGVHQTHTYVTNGNYTVTLTVTDNEDAHSISTETIEVINEAPTASFVATPTSGDIPFDVTLDASQSIDNDGQIVEYNWDFGDGTTFSTDTNDSFIHTYEKAGDFTITLTVIDNGGGTDSATAAIEAIDSSRINAPTELVVVSVTGSAVNLSWTVTSNNEEGFKIERAQKIRGKYDFNTDENPIGDTTLSNFNDTVTQIGTYKYRVYAYNDTAESVYSNEVLVKVETSLPPEPDPEPDPGTLSAPVLSASVSDSASGWDVALIWTNVCPEGLTCTYTIERGTGKNINQAVFAPLAPTAGTSYSINEESAGTYYYKVYATDSNNDQSANSNTVTVRLK